MVIKAIKDATKACYNCAHMVRTKVNASPKTRRNICSIDNEEVLHNMACNKLSHFYYKQGK